jgi:hypothetical protein
MDFLHGALDSREAGIAEVVTATSAVTSGSFAVIQIPGVP